MLLDIEFAYGKDTSNHRADAILEKGVMLRPRSFIPFISFITISLLSYVPLILTEFWSRPEFWLVT